MPTLHSKFKSYIMYTTNYYRLGLFALIFCCIASCAKKESTTGSPEAISSIKIIPLPNKIEVKQGVADLTNAALTLPPSLQQATEIITQGLASQGVALNSSATKKIHFEEDKNLGQEEYNLLIDDNGAKVSYSTLRGALYGYQSLAQIIATSPSKKTIPQISINDKPRYGYRGMHLDVGRHFFDVAFIKKYIDLLSMYKMNTFHWHLTEDQGWRIEIKKYPKLQQISAYRKETRVGHARSKPEVYDGKPYGGYYTQEQVKEVVAYASARGIEVIPEIEMPGHAQAAVAAYPELGCTGKKIDVCKTWGVFEDVFCPNEATFTFLQDVIDEILPLFPSKYIHIGGDECPKTQWKTNALCQEIIKRENLKDEHGLQSYFIQRMEKYINGKGKKIIGWDEILEGGLAQNATVMSWRGMDGGITAANQNHDVIMTPTDYVYFDYFQSKDPSEPLGIGGFLPLEKVYSFDPTPSSLPADKHKYILGTQGNLWSEYLPTSSQVEYMVLPRMQALAEVAWTETKNKSFINFIDRLKHHFTTWKKLGLNFADKTNEISSSVITDPTSGISLKLNTPSNGTIVYSDNNTLSAASAKYNGPLAITASKTLQVAPLVDGKLGRIDTFNFNLHKAAGKSISLTNMPADKYRAQGASSLINGISGSDKNYGTEWLGFEGKNFEGVIDLGTIQNVSQINLRFFNSPPQWIYPPKSVSVFFSQNNKDFNELPAFTIQQPTGTIANLAIPTADTKTRYIKVIAAYQTVPTGQPGAGKGAWVFVDEIQVL
jgi:hexosaminidase